MKTKLTLLIAFVSTCLFYNCTTDSSNNEEIIDPLALASKEWKEKNLTPAFFEHQETLSHYNFNKSDLQTILNKPNLVEFRFILGLKNNKLQIIAAGMDENQVIVGLISSSYNTDIIGTKASIASLKNSTLQYAKAKISQSIVGKHLLPYKNTYNYINNWKKAIQKQDIEELISYDGERIRHFSLEKEVVTAMIAPKNVDQIGLFLGLNTASKLTTVFVQKNNNGKLIFQTNLQKSNTILLDEGGAIYDFTYPCPDSCDACYVDGVWTTPCPPKETTE